MAVESLHDCESTAELYLLICLAHTSCIHLIKNQMDK